MAGALQAITHPAGHPTSRAANPQKTGGNRNRSTERRTQPQRPPTTAAPCDTARCDSHRTNNRHGLPRLCQNLSHRTTHCRWRAAVLPMGNTPHERSPGGRDTHDPSSPQLREYHPRQIQRKARPRRRLCRFRLGALGDPDAAIHRLATPGLCRRTLVPGRWTCDSFATSSP